MQRLGEVELSAHSAISHLCDFCFFAGVCRQHFNNLTRNQSGVTVKTDKTAGNRTSYGQQGNIDPMFGGYCGKVCRRALKFNHQFNTVERIGRYGALLENYHS